LLKKLIMSTQKKGFTLIELLIVIGILAVLATVTVLVLNPAELFRQARDSQRLSDLGSVRGAISLYLTTASTPVLGSSFTCGTNFGSSATTGTASSSFSGAATKLAANVSHQGIFAVDGTGWVPVPLSAMSGGAPLPTLPRDPRNTYGTTPQTNLVYQYACDTSSNNLYFELVSGIESTRYSNGGDDDVVSTDGGVNPHIYETGNAPGLNL
jgi:prepilin-type N-terminal cleavage/methylation domain-containing protein